MLSSGPPLFDELRNVGILLQGRFGGLERHNRGAEHAARTEQCSTAFSHEAKKYQDQQGTKDFAASGLLFDSTHDAHVAMRHITKKEMQNGSFNGGEILD